jgi:hypothetical protein
VREREGRRAKARENASAKMRVTRLMTFITRCVSLVTRCVSLVSQHSSQSHHACATAQVEALRERVEKREQEHAVLLAQATAQGHAQTQRCMQLQAALSQV